MFKIYIILAIVVGLLSGCGESSVDEKDFSSPETTAVSATDTSMQTEVKMDVFDDHNNKTESYLRGFWHSAPNFSGGFKETYRFGDFSNDFDYRDADGTIYRGYWNVKDGDVLELTYSTWDEDERVEKPAQIYDIEYIVADDGGETVTIDGKIFWKLQEPVDIINGIPLYIYYQSDDEKKYQNSEVIYVSSPNATGDNVILSYDGDLYDFKIIIVGFDFNDDDIQFYYNQEDIIFELEHLPPNFIVNYANADIGTAYAEGFSFRDTFGNYYAYAIWHGGRGDGWSNIGRIDLVNYEHTK